MIFCNVYIYCIVIVGEISGMCNCVSVFPLCQNEVRGAHGDEQCGRARVARRRTSQRASRRPE